MLNQSERDEIEALIDTYGLGDVLEAIASICHEKSEHLLSAWQDRNAARLWVRDAGVITKVATRVNH